MRKRNFDRLLTLLFQLIWLVGSTAYADYDFSKGGFQYSSQDHLPATVGGELLIRHEDWNWFGSSRGDYAFSFTRARLNIRAANEQFEVFIQPQFVLMDDVPDHALMPSPAGPAGMGALYYLHNNDTYQTSGGFHQAYLKLSGLERNTTLTLGRFTYSSGLEHLKKEDGKKFNTLKNLRLGDRMISSFEWSAYARSFDGGQIHYGSPQRFDITGSFMYPTQGGWEEEFNQSLEDVRISTVALSAPRGALYKGAELGLFAYNFADKRHCSQRVGNCPNVVAERADIDISMIGLHLVGLHELGLGEADYLLWGGYQVGDWYEKDHGAFSLASEAGYQWKRVPGKPWLRGGYFIGSGDGDPDDGDHGTFFQMAPGTRKYQLFPYYDLQNSEYMFAQLFLFPCDKVTLRVDYSAIALEDSDDRWYMGTGATQKEGGIFGYLGRPSMGNDELAYDISVALSYNIHPQMSLQLFYAHVWGRDVIERIYEGSDQADYFFVETSLKL